MPITGFEVAIKRSNRFLTLYKLLKYDRQRRVRADWSTSFKSLMHWPAGENITRIDGHGRKSMIILREELGISAEEFEHDMLSELLRAAIVASISALDRYMHDLIMVNIWSLLDQSEEMMDKELKKISVPAYQVKRALAAIRQEPGARPGGQMKKVIQSMLHRDYTFQKPEDLQKAAKIIGIRGFWDEVAREFPNNVPKSEIISGLRKITRRRNQIVHEADIYTKVRDRGVNVREIAEKEAGEAVAFVEDLVRSIDRVASN